MKKKRKVTFFYSRLEERQIFNQISEELKKNNFKVEFSTNLKKKADIGFYCESDSNPENSKISAIFLGGLDQGRLDWPNIWNKQPWSKFDLGFLPGINWAKRWKLCSGQTKARTKSGVYNVGWPKSDFLFNKNLKHKIKNKIIKKYRINPKKINILYAPSFECFDRQLEVTEAVKKNGYNLIVKHWLIKKEKKFIDLWNEIRNSNYKSKKIYNKKTFIIDPNENFLSILDFVNLIITDESSVAYEGLIKNVPTISVEDWMIRRHNKAVVRFVKPASLTFRTKKRRLDTSIKKLINNKSVNKKLKSLLRKEISYLGKSSKIVTDLLVMFLKNKELPKKTQYFIKPKTKVSMIDNMINSLPYKKIPFLKNY